MGTSVLKMRNFTSLAHVGPDDEVVEETPPRVPELHQVD